MSDDTATPVAGGEGEAGWEKELASGEGAIAGTDWMRLLDAEGDAYFYNSVTEENQWTVPAEVSALGGGSADSSTKPEEAEPEPEPAPEPEKEILWKATYSEEYKREYFTNTLTGEVQWDPPSPDQQLRSVFDKFDTDKSGYLDKAELHACLRSAGSDISEDEALALFQTLDGSVDSDGEITFEEFGIILGGLIQSSGVDLSPEDVTKALESVRSQLCADSDVCAGNALEQRKANAEKDKERLASTVGESYGSQRTRKPTA